MPAERGEQMNTNMTARKERKEEEKRVYLGVRGALPAPLSDRFSMFLFLTITGLRLAETHQDSIAKRIPVGRRRVEEAGGGGGRQAAT